MQPEQSRTRFRLIALFTAALIVACRVWLAVDVPLTDTTEARYSEMARKMVETGNWLMPQHDYGVPYLAKPPLAMWMSAAGIEMLGPNELGPRLLILLTAIGFLWYFHRWLRREIGPGAADAGVLTLLGSTLFFVAMAAVMTDLVLVACIDIALLAFWHRMRASSRLSEIVLFSAMGLGLLTKGPLAAFLILVPIALWAALCRKFPDVWRRIGWFKGFALAALIALPWYVAAEWRYPGFLRYFLVGENLQRLLVSDWQGDQYGAVHEAQHGLIWVYLWIAALPWSLFGAVFLLRVRRTVRDNWHANRELVLFAISAALVPMALFTAAKNIIFPYALPAIVPCVIAALALLGEDMMTSRFMTSVAITAGATAVALALSGGALRGRIAQESERELVAETTTDLHVPADSLHYWRHRYFSADYYSRGQADVLTDVDQIYGLLGQHAPFALVIEDEDFAALPDDLKPGLHELRDYGEKSVYGAAPVPAVSMHAAVAK